MSRERAYSKKRDIIMTLRESLHRRFRITRGMGLALLVVRGMGYSVKELSTYLVFPKWCVHSVWRSVLGLEGRGWSVSRYLLPSAFVPVSLWIGGNVIQTIRVMFIPIE